LSRDEMTRDEMSVHRTFLLGVSNCAIKHWYFDSQSASIS